MVLTLCIAYIHYELAKPLQQSSKLLLKHFALCKWMKRMPARKESVLVCV
jgi:hypothetical protein